jgi:hypothetical protein
MTGPAPENLARVLLNRSVVNATGAASTERQRSSHASRVTNEAHRAGLVASQRLHG